MTAALPVQILALVVIPVPLIPAQIAMRILIQAQMPMEASDLVMAALIAARIQVPIEVLDSLAVRVESG